MWILSLTVLALAIGGAIVWWRRRREERVQLTRHCVLCPRHEVRAAVTVWTDPAARSSLQYLGVASCSLLSDAATGLPERVAYSPDGDALAYKTRLAPATSRPVYASEVDCPEDCVFALNRAAVFGTQQPVESLAGSSDAIELARHAMGSHRVARLMTYYGG